MLWSVDGVLTDDHGWSRETVVAQCDGTGVDWWTDLVDLLGINWTRRYVRWRSVIFVLLAVLCPRLLVTGITAYEHTKAHQILTQLAHMAGLPQSAAPP